MSTFIHNEPTSLSILQEMKLPQTFLTIAAQSGMPISAEVISALPNAFGAVCLNSSGLENFNEVKPMKRFFEILTDDEHIRSLQDKDVPHLIGNAVDELIRHHPSLKDGIMKEVIAMVNFVVEVGNTVRPEELEQASLRTDKSTDGMIKDDDDDFSKKDKRDTRTVVLVDVVSRVCITKLCFFD
jgi:E3 ubiquitin-protein ligase HUWE1